LFAGGFTHSHHRGTHAAQDGLNVGEIDIDQAFLNY
jgi:hypothetical protein